MASVASRNLFEILADNEDVEPVVSERDSTPKESVVVQKKVDRSRASPKEARIRHEYPQRGGFKPSPPHNRNEDSRSGAPRDRNVGPRLSSRREEGGDYPGRTSRGARPSERGRGGRGGGRRGREHDRHSGTGRYDSEKKENQGWGNGPTSWNNVENNTEATTNKGEADTNTNTDATSWGDGTADNGAEGGWTEETAEGQESGVTQDGGPAWEVPAELVTSTEGREQKEEAAAAVINGENTPVVEQEESYKTLDEYRAEKAPKAQVAALPEARKANEGVDDSQWKDAVPLEKDDEEDILFAGKEHSFRLKSKKARAKNFLEIEQTFIEKTGAGYPRGRGRGRGGPRGRGDRRESRDGRDGRDNYEGENRRRDGRDNYEGENRRRDGRDNYEGENRRRDGRDNYEGENRRRGGGGGGGGGGGRGRGRGRGDYVNLDDQRAFPSLGAA